MNVTRLITLDDAAALASLLRVNREFLAPWEPVRPEEYFTVEGQLARPPSTITCGSFVRIGMAPGYIAIAGRWQDHFIYQTLNSALPPT